MTSMRNFYSAFFPFLFLPGNVRVILTLNVLNSSEYILKYSATDVKRDFRWWGKCSSSWDLDGVPWQMTISLCRNYEKGHFCRLILKSEYSPKSFLMAQRRNKRSHQMKVKKLSCIYVCSCVCIHGMDNLWLWSFQLPLTYPQKSARNSNVFIYLIWLSL